MAAFGYLSSLRASVRARFFQVLERAFATDDGKRILASALRGLLATEGPRAALAANRAERPYDDLGQSILAPRRPAPVFITARFRSGSTLLWNLFRNVPECTAFYEPLNERRWFDPSLRGDRVDDAHVGVSDYWREYDGLPHLRHWYREHWIDRNLYMGRSFWDPDLFAYINALIEAAPQRAVLQFNRVDFRLEWLKQHFPSAVLVHLYRHPRDEWCSTLLDLTRIPMTASVTDFESQDAFYLLPWARDLSYHFPCLDPRLARHPYEIFYLIWKLSWLFGRQHGDVQVCYERLCGDAEHEIPRLMHSTRMASYDTGTLQKLIARAPRPRWPQYAPAEWFEEIEARCETTLQLAFGMDRREAFTPVAAAS
jgi:hypothetical protein